MIFWSTYHIIGRDVIGGVADRGFIWNFNLSFSVRCLKASLCNICGGLLTLLEHGAVVATLDRSF